MSVEAEIKEFKRTHPHPDEAGQKSLFRFSKATSKLEYLRSLLVDGKLYHSLPSQFNDPFEAKPHFRWPTSGRKVREIRKHLMKVARRQGKSRKEGEAIVAKAMRTKDTVFNSIYTSARETYSRVRICCFTSSKENLLFWAHYADSHKGFSVEYDASVLPISYAFRLKYSNEYPEIEYPPTSDSRALRPLLIKSDHWAYEQEFRTIFVPEADRQPANDGQSLILSGNEITNIYFGALMEERHQEKILALLKEGPFRPGIWQAKLSEFAFELQFEPLQSIEI